MPWLSSTVQLLTLIILLICLGCAARWPRAWSKWSLVDGPRWAQLPWIMISLSALLGLLINAAYAVLVDWPLPSIHDEFAYLLTADTFAHGRLTNPSPPVPAAFSSWHLIVQPFYQGKYPPAQGLVLAIGQWIGGFPLLGVWVSLAAAIGALCWALQQWLPARWAALGTFLWLAYAPLHLRWGQTYWGGAVAMFGGALVVGAVPGFVRGNRSWLPLAVGTIVLLASRPLEGGLFVLPAWAFAFWQWWHGRTRCSWLRFMLSASVLSAGATGLLTYNMANTGRLWVMPYQVWTAQQGGALERTLLPTGVPVSGHASRDTLASPPEGDWRPASLQETMEARRAAGWGYKLPKLPLLLAFYLSLALWLPLAFALPRLATTQYRVLASMCGLTLASNLLHFSAPHPHYLAPSTAGLAVLVVSGLRELRTAGRASRWGAALAAACVIAWFAGSACAWAEAIIRPPGARQQAWAARRLAIEQQLAALPGRQIVLVRYTPDHSIHQEWVYNSAEVAAQKVIWANDLGPGEDATLRAAWPSTTFHRLVVDRDRETLTRDVQR
jgi:hypothetical protein